MKFLYEYRTKDNIRHEGVINAASREAAFDALRSQGIKPGRLWEAPGLMNKIFGQGKRWIAIFVLGVVVLLMMVYLGVEKVQASVDSRFLERSQIYGDPAFLGLCEAKGWSNVFADEGECFLARFAQPGRKVELPDGQLSGDAAKLLESALTAGVDRYLELQAGDSEEVVKIKRIVNGMKRELAEYIASGGTVNVYIERLIERQKIERTIFESARNELLQLEQRGRDEAARPAIILKWNEKNKLLRDMGLMPIPLPQEWDE